MRHDLGVPPQAGSGHSRAEPEEVSVVPASVPNADFVEHVAGAICLAVGDEAAALAAIAEVEHWLTAYLKRCALEALNSGSDFNQGVVRGLEIAAAQVEHGHYQNHPPSLASGTPTRRAETTGSVGEADGGPTVATSDGDAQPQSGVNRHG